MTQQDDIVVNGKRALANQLIIGLLPTVLVLGGALWAYGGDFSTVKSATLRNTERIIQVEENIERLENMAVDIAEIKATLEYIKPELRYIRDQLK